jgi:hypothetical protein
MYTSMSGQNSDTDRNYDKPVTTRLTKETNQQFEEWREEHGFGKTEGARRLINDAIDARTGGYEFVEATETVDAHPLRTLSIFAGVLYAGNVLTDELAAARIVGGLFIVIVALYSVWPLLRQLREP